MNIERLLWIAELYVLNVEEMHHTPRTILPHGASFQGHQIILLITSESPKQEFMLVVSYHIDKSHHIQQNYSLLISNFSEREKNNEV